MRIDEIRRVLVVGAGTIGQQVGLQCATHGYAVVLYARTPKTLDDAMTQTKAYAAKFVDEGRLTRAEADGTLSRITSTTKADEAADEADLLSESVPEDPRLKGKVFAQFNKLCPPRTIFTTNSSQLLPSMFAKATGRPAQFAALHFNKDVWVSNVVDIMPHPGTSEETVALLIDFAKRIGQTPILLKKEKAGYIVNGMLRAGIQEALTIVVNGLASVEDVDRAWMGIVRTPIGPFGILDDNGLDTAWRISDFWAKKYFFLRQLRRNANFLKEYVDKGRLGVKSGQGFYTYPDPAFRQPGFIEGTNRKS
jgi:3-hydroxybutyryl-CoA dehydrogenase